MVAIVWLIWIALWIWSTQMTPLIVGNSVVVWIILNMVLMTMPVLLACLLPWQNAKNQYGNLPRKKKINM